jgi:phosphoglycolate phosphatase
MDLHLVSGTPHDELCEIVALRGLAGWFRSVRGAPPVKRVAFERILHEGGYAPGEVLAVGDALTECEAARDLGVAFLGVVPAGSHNRFPPEVPVVATLESVPELLKLPKFVRYHEARSP